MTSDHRLVPDGGERHVTHSVLKGGIQVRKRVEAPAVAADEMGEVELTIANRRASPGQVRVDERIPSGCDPMGTRAETGDAIRWSADDAGRTLCLGLNLEAAEQRQITYRIPVSRPDAFATLARRSPEITLVRYPNTDKSLGELTPPGIESEQSKDDSLSGRPEGSASGIDPDHPYLDPPPAQDFGDIAGLTETKRELRETVLEPFRDPRYDEYGIGKTNGVLLYGPPGTGKTHVAKCLAGELGYNFLEVTSSMLRDSSLGGSVAKAQDLFEAADAHQPCVVFLDELDGLLPARDDSLHQARRETVNEVLQWVAEVNERDADVLVVGATNQPDGVDAAAKRTGRFDTRLKIGLPDASTRLALLEHELRAFEGPVDNGVMDQSFLDEFTDRSQHMAASDVIEVVDAATRTALRESAHDEPPVVRARHLLAELETVEGKRQADTAGEFLTEPPELDFSDVGGMDATKSRLEELFLRPIREDPALYEAYGLEPANGLLLYGPPGTGKTYLARAAAGEANCSFLEVTAADIVSKWVGEAAQNLQELFERARDIAPAIVFIDEIDAIAATRGRQQQTNSEAQAVNQLLAELTELQETEVFVIGATNRLSQLDPALLRAGRLGEQIEVPPPDREGRIAILRQELDGRPCDLASIGWDRLAEATEIPDERVAYVAADMSRIANEAARCAMADADEAPVPITQAHVEAAIEAVPPSLGRSVGSR